MMTREKLYAHFRLLRELRNQGQTIQKLKNSKRDYSGILEALTEEAEELKRKCEAQEKEIRDFISKIESGRVKTMIRLRFLCGDTWKDIAAVTGGTEDSARSTVYKYLAGCFD